MSRDLELQLIVSGAHLSNEFGYTIDELEQDGFRATKKIETLLSSDTTTGTVKTLGVALMGFAEAFEDLKPDMLLLVGDRYELMAPALTALIHNIPIAHIHGGELTFGAVDDAVRHSLTKLSHLHFVSTSEHQKRVIQLGEQPEFIFNVGALGVENTKAAEITEKTELSKLLNFTFRERNLLVTFHPETVGGVSNAGQLHELLTALQQFKDVGIVFTMPNPEVGSKGMFSQIEAFVGRTPSAAMFKSLGQQKYFSLVRACDGVLGNSSSGLIEVPSLGRGTINVGRRQDGRVRGESVIDCAPKAASIVQAIETLFSPAYQEKLSDFVNPYGDGNTSAEIFEVLERADLSKLRAKRFCDLS